MTTLQAIKAQKKALRKAISTTLSLLPQSEIDEQSRSITARVLSLPAFLQCKTISCYLSMPSGEVATPHLVSEIISQDKTFFAPKIHSKDGYMDFFEIFGADDLASLPSGTWGIKEPALNSDSELLDVILLPGVAFDRSLSRLGHGKGYYDRFITSYTSNGRRRPLLSRWYQVGLALREQVLNSGEIPMAEHDWRLDMVIAPDEILTNREV
ncbi:uncharacterized protein LACBIDRAFT_250233 [Laccaria bicolor S238N-H82]|uniref:5-formyltetrahydrofolate cyclo-ligase n=1 Tax=Laccaria bicolor (strain S238N-H82 / ATCC MYA-4686) TaxID=486041 RepID=B0DAR9_LACBS|nr:uncharacterized protein LACBIDRAFT_250233 [Laccaria bicolor S238N-H82]EDR08073.1 predicted protein [Laccaria bicolor S238N-H82]|eukprot:XP_001881143.1 predicted protein [Laccaria bicolor S238N-H82]